MHAPVNRMNCVSTDSYHTCPGGEGSCICHSAFGDVTLCCILKAVTACDRPTIYLPAGKSFFAPDIYCRALIEVDQSNVAPVGNKRKHCVLLLAGTSLESAWPSATLGPREIGTRREIVVLHAAVFTPSWAARPLNLPFSPESCS